MFTSQKIQSEGFCARAYLRDHFFEGHFYPWDSLDHFERAQIKDVIRPTPSSKQDAPSTPSVAKCTKGPLQFIVPKSGRRQSDLLSSQELIESAKRLNASSSKS